jgi:predicted DNA-binding transcriptional regulator AlpA
MQSGDAEIQRIPVVRQRLGGVCNDTVYRLVKTGRLKAPVKLAGGRASGWFKADVDAYLAHLRAGHDATAATRQPVK